MALACFSLVLLTVSPAASAFLSTGVPVSKVSGTTPVGPASCYDGQYFDVVWSDADGIKYAFSTNPSVASSWTTQTIAPGASGFVVSCSGSGFYVYYEFDETIVCGGGSHAANSVAYNQITGASIGAQKNYLDLYGLYVCSGFTNNLGMVGTSSGSVVYVFSNWENRIVAFDPGAPSPTVFPQQTAGLLGDVLLGGTVIGVSNSVFGCSVWAIAYVAGGGTNTPVCDNVNTAASFAGVANGATMDLVTFNVNCGINCVAAYAVNYSVSGGFTAFKNLNWNALSVVHTAQVIVRATVKGNVPEFLWTPNSGIATKVNGLYPFNETFPSASHTFYSDGGSDGMGTWHVIYGDPNGGTDISYMVTSSTPYTVKWNSQGVPLISTAKTVFVTVVSTTVVTVGYAAVTTIGTALANWIVFLFVNFVPLALFTWGAFIFLRSADVRDDRAYLFAFDLVLVAMAFLGLISGVIPTFAMIISIVFFFGTGTRDVGQSEGSLAD